MRTASFFLFAALAGCSNNNPSADAGPDSSTTDAPTTNDVTTSDVTTDTGGCNVTASATIVGTFLGSTLSPKDEIAYESHPTSQYEVVVGVSDYSPACSLGNDNKANSSAMAIIYSDTTPLVPATIDLTKTSVLFAQYTKFDATCQSTGESATSGTVTFTRVDSCGVVGTFDLTFNADHVTGSFSAPVCANLPDGGASACK
jgi:hypothetical protein